MQPTHDGSGPPAAGKVARIIRLFEHCVMFVLMALLMVVVALSTVEFAWLRVTDLRTMEVALIALAQKVIILDTSRAGGPTLFGLSGLVLALTLAFWGVRAARRRPNPPTP